MGEWGARLLLGALRLFQRLPLGVQAALGRGLGALLWRLACSRRRIALRNLELCLPELPVAERERLARDHFGWLARSLLERALLWYAPAERLKRLIQVEGDVGLAERSDKPVMWLVPHFLALDVAGIACLAVSETNETGAAENHEGPAGHAGGNPGAGSASAGAAHLMEHPSEPHRHG